MSVRRNSGADPAGATERRALGLLLEGAAINLPQIDPERYRLFRSAILRDSIRIAEPQSETDLLQLAASLIREFEAYRSETEAAVAARTAEWRQLAAMLLAQLAAHSGFDLCSADWRAVADDLASASTEHEIGSLRRQIQALGHRTEGELHERKGEIEQQDLSVANDNAAGLRGGGAAIEHVRRMIVESRPGYIGLFHLSCLDVVGERFGPEGLQDCLMTVSSFLIENLRREDVVYHWSDSSLLAVCDRKIREEILIAELNRILARNRDFTLQIGDRTIMVRIPIDLQVFPIEHFESADDLLRLPASRNRRDRPLAERPPAGIPSKQHLSQRNPVNL